MSVKIEKLTGYKGKRIIAVSDIHGNIGCFDRLMKKVGFSDQDILIIVGDFLEKGPENLKTLRAMMELSMRDNVHIICGNCEIIWEFVKSGSLDSWFLPYSLSRRSLLEEMCRELSIPVSLGTELGMLKKRLGEAYHEELEWLENLPVIIESEDLIFVHAGLTSENLDEQDFFRCVKTDAFMDCGLCFQKYVVVGHWPTNNYGTQKASFNPIVNSSQHIVSIDGGNMIKNSGQLNALIISNPGDLPQDMGEGCFSYEYCDELPRGLVANDQRESVNSISISWLDNKIELLEEGEEFSYCLHVPTQYRLMIPNNHIYEAGGCFYCTDSTDYMLQAKKGETVSIIESWSDRYLAKKNGVVGWIMGKPEPL